MARTSPAIVSRRAGAKRWMDKEFLRGPPTRNDLSGSGAEVARPRVVASPPGPRACRDPAVLGSPLLPNNVLEVGFARWQDLASARAALHQVAGAVVVTPCLINKALLTRTRVWTPNVMHLTTRFDTAGPQPVARTAATPWPVRWSRVRCGHVAADDVPEQLKELDQTLVSIERVL